MDHALMYNPGAPWLELCFDGEDVLHANIEQRVRQHPECEYHPTLLA